MSSKKDKDHEESFEYKLRDVSDERIMSILKMREHYHPRALTEAIREAIKRGIINSVDDLDKPEFLPDPMSPRSLFSVGNNDMQTMAIFKSLCRIFYGIGLLPILYGVFRISEQLIVPGIAAIIIGLIVIILANRLNKSVKPFYAQILLAMNVPVIGFAIYKLSQTGNPSLMDGVATSVIIFVILYTTFYANKITSYFDKRQNEE